MKKLLLTIGVLGILNAVATAGFKVPRYAHENLDEAMAEAAKEDKPLAFIYTDPASS